MERASKQGSQGPPDIVGQLAEADPHRDAVQADRVQREVAARLFGDERPQLEIGRYVVLERTGSGAMGVVYAAYDPALDRRVALKLVAPGRRGGADELMAEARKVASLSHPNVVAVYDVGRHGESVYMAMELVPGTTLRRWLERGQRSRREILEVFFAAGEGLQAAHDASLVHRDFKPENVLIGEDGRVRVLDFGLAKQMGERDPSIDSDVTRSAADPLEMEQTADGFVKGTPLYMAPEQHEGDSTDARTDVYSFCVALFEAVCGARPFAGTTPSEIEAAKRSELRFPRPSGTTTLTPWLRRVLRRGLATDPDHRYQGLRPLLADLRRGLNRRRRVTLAGTAIGVVLAGLAYGELRAQGPDPCPPPDTTLLDVWDRELGPEVRASFLSTDRAYAPAAWRGTDEGVRRFAADWAATTTAVCRSARVTGDWSDSMIDEANTCLATQLDEAEALVEVLRTANAPVVARAADAARRLPDPQVCRDPRHLATLEAAPPEPTQRARVAELRRALAAATALRAAGRFGSSADESQRVLAAAADLGYAPLLHEAQLAHALSLRRLGSVSEALTVLDAALQGARRVGATNTELEAQVALVGLLGDALGRSDEGLRWAGLASATLEHTGPNPILEASLETRVGEVMLRASRYSDARSHFTAAVDKLEEGGRGAHPDGIYALHRTADALVFEGQLDEAEALLHQVLATRIERLGNQHPDVGWTHNDIGMLLFRRGDLESALDSIDTALTIRVAALGPDHQRVAHSLMSRGAVLHALGRFAEARDSARAAVETVSAQWGPSNHLTTNYRLNLARAHTELGATGEARKILESVREAQESVEPLAAVQESLATADARLAEVTEEFAEAQRLYQRALTVNPRSAEAWHGLARTRLALGDALGSLEAINEAWTRTPANAVLSRADLAFDRARARWETGLRDQAVAEADDAYTTIVAAGVTPPGTKPLTTWLNEHR